MEGLFYQTIVSIIGWGSSSIWKILIDLVSPFVRGVRYLKASKQDASWFDNLNSDKTLMEWTLKYSLSLSLSLSLSPYFHPYYKNNFEIRTDFKTPTWKLLSAQIYKAADRQQWLETDESIVKQ